MNGANMLHNSRTNAAHTLLDRGASQVLNIVALSEYASCLEEDAVSSNRQTST